jgi:hypothetical protein
MGNARITHVVVSDVGIRLTELGYIWHIYNKQTSIHFDILFYTLAILSSGSLSSNKGMVI